MHVFELKNASKIYASVCLVREKENEDINKQTMKIKLQKISTGSIISVMGAKTCTHTYIPSFSYCKQENKSTKKSDHTLTKSYTKETNGMQIKEGYELKKECFPLILLGI